MNVCILRIPAHESIVTGPSHCPRCGKKLKWYELIPIFSFLALRGRCSNCKLPISAQYPIIEAVNGILWLLIFYVLGFSPYAVLACLMVSALFVLSVIDVRTREIPQGINVFILVLAITAALIDRQNFTSHIIGFFSISAPLYLILIITHGKGIGGGDVKLMAVCGLFLGWKLVVLAFFIGCLAASIIHLFLMAAKKADRSLSFGPYLSAGIFLALLWGNLIIDCYLSLYK
ncbi:MAG: prepilin peptidase [Clostridiales bacterium]|nr:prepilin peptidase [Clostridiales bacterium]